MKQPAKNDPILQLESQASWTGWLQSNHHTSSGIWLRLAKATSKHTTEHTTVTYAEALEAALCYGWIDGQKRSDDDQFWLQRFTPRSSKSIWSQRNREKANALIQAGKMAPAGMREIERAKNDGRWHAAYASAKNASIPEDFQAALDRNREAKAFFGKLNSQNRYAILFRIQAVKKAETRAKKIRTFIDMLANGEKLYP